MLEFLYATAARVGEVVKVRVKDVNFRQRTVLLHGKTGDRVVPFGKKAAKALRAYLAGRQTGYLFTEAPKVRTKNGRSLSTDAVYRIVRRAASLAGLKQISPIVLRHSCAVALMDAGADACLVQELLGHSRSS